MVSVVDFVVVVVGVVVVIVVVVVFGRKGVPVPHVILVRHGAVGMGTRQELGIDVVGPLRE